MEGKGFQSVRKINGLLCTFQILLWHVVKYLQVMILSVLPKYLGSSGANYAKNLLRAAILVQYFPRLFRFLPLLIGQSPTGFIFESAWANFIINLLIFMLSGHVVGSFWYLFGLQVSKNVIWSFVFRKYKISSSYLTFIICFEFMLHGKGG